MKKQISALLTVIAMLMTCTAASASEPYSEKTRIGDVNKDSSNSISIDDATLLQRYLAEFETLEQLLKNANAKRTLDADLDDTVSISDVTEIQRFLAEMPSRYVGKTVGEVYGEYVTPPDTREQRLLEKTVKKYRFEGVACIIKDGKTAAVSALSVDDKLGKYFPECPYGNRVTLRQMMKMRSGIAEFYEEIYDDYNINELPVGELRYTLTNNGSKEDNRDILQRWLFSQPLRYTPGSKCVYCNSNYFLLARLVEKVSGVPYETFIEQNILLPLEMNDTAFIDDGIGDLRLAKNTHPAKTVFVGITMGLGDLITTVGDMQKWMTSFFGNRLLSAASIRAMTYSDSYSGYGYGVVPLGSGKWCHYGIFTSYAAFDYVAPQQQYAVFAVTNNQSALNGEVNSMCFELNDLLL